MNLASPTGYSSINSGVSLEHFLKLDLEESFPHEGEHRVRPYENLGIVRMNSGSSRTPFHTHIKTHVLDGVLMRYRCG